MPVLGILSVRTALQLGRSCMAFDAVARILLTSAYWWSGIDKLTHFGVAVAETRALGVPWPSLAAATTIAVQLAGSAAVIVNRGAWLGAGALAAFTLVVSVIAHPFWRTAGPGAERELATFLEHLGLVGGFLLVMRASRRIPRSGDAAGSHAAASSTRHPRLPGSPS